jgi:succinoglycan biosynthesis transport protein ExoP
LPFWILPAGSAKHRSIGLLKSRELHKILTELRSRFEHIILDAPPILPLADMTVLASMADVLALVIRAGATGRDIVQRAIKTVRDSSRAAIILNGLEAGWTSYSYPMQQEYYLGADDTKRV